MKIVVMPDKFKGTLSSHRAAKDICEGIVAAAASRGRSDIEVVAKPMADGGEGTLMIVVEAEDIVPVESCDALLRPVTSMIGIKKHGDTKHGIIESATCLGLSRLARHERNPELTTSYGLGLQIGYAIESGCRKLTIAIGGTATNDCGAGMLSALGARHYDAHGELIVHPAGKDLINIEKIDLGDVVSKLNGIDITIMCDVDNPLFGSEGATMTFGGQKGADREMLERLERGVRHYSELVSCATGRAISAERGSGAAGGIGWALRSVSEAVYAAGAETVSKITNLKAAVEGAALLVTGEGRCDASSLHGKVVGYTAQLGQKSGIPVLVLCGIRDRRLTAETVRQAGIDSIHALTEYVTFQEAVSHPSEELRRMTKLIFEQLL